MRGTIIVLLAVLSVTSLEAQDSTQVLQDSASTVTPKSYRDPHLARVLGIILPGAGHFYAGEYLRGYSTWVVTVVGIGAGPLIYDMDSCSLALFRECKPGAKWPYQLAGALMVGSGVWRWISTAIDAPHAAERANERHRSRSLKVSPLIKPSVEPDAEFGAGIAIRW
jgi:TM2 domain-containing membrane protein YozV